MGYFDGEKYIDNTDNSTQPIINLGHPSPFLKKLQEREPTLFLKEDSQAYSQYSKLCPWNIRRYPIILTKEEKDEIDKESPDSYHSSIEYGTNPKKKFYYICPQYWNLRTNKPVKKEDVNPSTVIGQKETNPDLTKKYIFEFSTQSKGHHALPSFLDKKSHPQGHFIPCCFKLNKQGEIPKAQIKRIEEAAQLMAKMENKNSLKPNKNVKLEEDKDVSEYIQNGLKFPLPNKRKGELSVALETFFGFNHATCYSNLKTKKFKINTPCLFRRGVENNKNQSFLAVLAFIYKNENKQLTMQEIKQLILDKINIDNIQDFHNGNLSHTFSKDNYFDQDISQYVNSKLYTKMENNIEGFKKIANGLENFYKYILDNEVNIDYTYLWDIVCSGILKNTKSKKPINLIILNETMDDVTQNINIICPTTVHSKFLFNLNNKSIIIYKKGDYYEPLIIYKEDAEFIYDDIFEIKLKDDIPFMTNILNSINSNLGQCNGSIINKYYTFKNNISLIELLDELKKLEAYSVKTQIMNYDGKIIALIVVYTEGDKIRSFYVPCKPSSKESLDYEVINDSHWKNYATTVKYLKKLYIDSNKKIPCLPKFRVIDKSLIVGILTITNQFVMLKTPEENKFHDELKELNEHHYIHYLDEEYINYDFEIKNNKLVKEQDIISYLKLEQQFYNAYFNTLKVLINDIKNLQIRKKIETILQNIELPYIKQYDEIKEILMPLLNKFEYINYTPNVLKEIIEVNICKNNISNYCKEDGTLLIPKINLFTKQNNEDTYIHKFIDNLIRNHNIQTSIFEENHSTIFYTDEYNLSDNEILILESSLFTYIESLGEIIKKNNYIEFRGLEDLTPNEIFQLLEKEEPQNEESKSENIKLSYNTNNNNSPQQIDLFGIEPNEEVKEIIKQPEIIENTANFVMDENEESNDDASVKEEESLDEKEEESVDEKEEPVDEKVVSEDKSVKEEPVDEKVVSEDKSVEEVSEDKSVEEEYVKEKSVKKESVKEKSDKKESVKEKSGKKEKSVKEEEDEEDEQEDEEEEQEDEEDEQSGQEEEQSGEEEDEEQEEKDDEEQEEKEQYDEEDDEEQSANNKLQKINLNEPKRIKLKKECKAETMITDIYKEKLNNGLHKCIHKQYLSPVWKRFFKDQTTVWLNFGLKLNHNDPPSTSCNYFMLSLILKDCDENIYKNQFSSKYIDNIKSYLIKGYQKLVTSNNLLPLVKKWKITTSKQIIKIR